MAPSFDHFTPLSRAVASIDRDAYAARFAVYDREYKALLRRLASAGTPVSAADLAREEQAFRDAVRRVEFGEEHDAPSLVPRDEPVEEASPARLRELVVEARSAPPRDPIWPRLSAQRLETAEASEAAPAAAPEPDQGEAAGEAAAAIEPLLERSPQRSLVRRVGERLALAVLALGLFGVGVWLAPRREVAVTNPPAHTAAQSAEPAAADAPTATQALQPKSQLPQWLSPQMFYMPPPMPTAPPAPAAPPSAAPLPRADVPLPIPRPNI